jgi:integrase
MPRLTHAVPKYCKHRGSGQAVVTINGRDYYLGPHGTKASKLEYDRLIGEWLADGRSYSFGAPAQQISVMELLADYLQYAKEYYGTHPKGEYPQVVRSIRPVKELYGRTPAAEFGPLQLKAVRETLVTTDRSRRYINDTIRRIVRVFRWGAGEGKLPAGVPQALAMVPGLRRGKTQAKETDPILPVDEETIDATLPCMPSVVADMVSLQRLTGARPAEICILRPCDVDRTGDVWTYTPTQHKTAHHGKSRLILIGPQAQAVLLRYLARDSEAFCFRPVDSEEKRRAALTDERKTPLSCGNRSGTNRKRKPKRQPGEHYTTDSYRRAIHRSCDKAFPHPTLSKVKRMDLTDEQRAELAAWQSEHRWSPNQLRHAAATEIRRQFGLEAAQVILGHSSANVTQIYAERDLAKAMDVARQVG